MNPTSLVSILETLLAGLRLLPTCGINDLNSTIKGANSILEVNLEKKTPETCLQEKRTVGDWLDVYKTLLEDRNYKIPTLKNHSANITHVRNLWGHRPLQELKPHEISTKLKEFSKGRTSSACRVLSEIREAYTEAIANGWTETNPAAYIKPPRHKILRCRLKFETWISMREHSKNHKQKWIESMLLLALATGQRRADLEKMKFSDVVLNSEGEEVLRVEQQKEAGKGYGARVEIPLDLYLESISMSVRDVIEHCRNSARPGNTLLRKLGGGPIEQSSLSARFHEVIVTVLGKNAYKRYEWPSLHEVRSLSARLYKKQNLDVQTLMGHKTAEMTAMYEDDRGLSSKEWKRVKPERSQTPIKTQGINTNAVLQEAPRKIIFLKKNVPKMIPQTAAKPTARMLVVNHRGT